MLTNLIQKLDYSFCPTDSRLLTLPLDPLAQKLDFFTQKLEQTPNPKILYCITSYNEPGMALLGSLAGVKQNLDYLVKAGKKSLAEQITLCLVFDGRAKISPSSLKLLETLELYSPKKIQPGIGVHLFESRLKLAHVEELMTLERAMGQGDDPWLTVYQTAQQENKYLEGTETLDSVNVLICIKEQNVGKLNSHWWFFQVFCTYLKPDYCIQMDVGCVPKACNINDLWEFLEQNTDVGAAAGSLIVPEPEAIWQLTHLWQFGNFSLDKLLFTPAEVVGGYLSVLPGQFSMLRWQALISDNPKHSPLNRYFQGLDQLNLFQSNMFLAEDRILGFGIVTVPENAWRLAHLSSVVTVTDPCQSLSELLRQRRRWINGSLACRLWVLAELPTYLSDNRASLMSKGRLLKAVPLYLLRTFTDWFYPALSLNVWILIFSSTQNLLVDLSWPTLPLNIAFVLGILLLVFQLILCLINRLTQVFWVVNVIYSSIFLMTVLSLWISVNPYVFLSLIALILIPILVFAKIHSSWLFSKIWKYLPFYFLIDSAVNLLLKTYSFYNINDCSWGTKGLTKAQENLSSKGVYLTLWLGSNALLLLLVFNFKLSVFFVIVALLDLGIGMISGLLISILMIINKKI